MRSTYKLAVPFLLTFSNELGTRQEIVSHVTFHTAYDEADVEPLRGYQDADDMLARLELDGCTPDEVAMLRAELATMDLDYGLRSAYADAEHRAMSFLAASSQPEHAGRFPIDIPSRDERRAASFRQAEDWLRDHPEEAARANEAAKARTAVGETA